MTDHSLFMENRNKACTSMRDILNKQEKNDQSNNNITNLNRSIGLNSNRANESTKDISFQNKTKLYNLNPDRANEMAADLGMEVRLPYITLPKPYLSASKPIYTSKSNLYCIY